MTTVLQKYSANILLDYNPKSGLHRDQSPIAAGFPTFEAGAQSAPNAVKTTGASTGVLFPSNASYKITSGTILVFADFSKGIENQKRLVYNADRVSRNFDLYFGSTTALSLYNGSVSSACAFVNLPKSFVGVVMPGNDKWKAYSDGAFQGLSNVAFTPTDIQKPIYIGGYVAANFGYGTRYYRVVILSNQLTHEEMSQVYEEEMASGHRRTLSKRNFKQPNPAVVDAITWKDVLADGDMEAVGTSAWSAVGRAILSKEDNGDGGQCLRIARGSAGSAYASQLVMTVGKRYRILGRARGDGANQPRLYGGGTTYWTGTSSTSWQYFDVSGIQLTNTSFNPYCSFTVAGYVEFDDIQVLEDDGRYSVQLLTDGDMETSGVAAWTAVNFATLSKETALPHSGTQALRITSSGAVNPSAYSGSVLTVGKRYRIMGWARGDGTRIPEIVNFWTGTSSASWQYFDFVFTADNVALRLKHNSSSGYVEFDDIVLVEDHLVGHWDMQMANGLVQDLSNEGNNLTKVGQVSQVQGVFDKALKFDGSSGYLSKSIANFRSVDSFGSITAWVKLDAIGLGTKSIFSSSDTATNTKYFLFEVATTGQLLVQNSVSGVASPSNYLVAGKLHHVALVSTGTTYRMFIDGVSVTVATSYGTNDGGWFSDVADRDNISIGAATRLSKGEYLNGGISDVKVWSKTLSDAEVLADYVRGAKMLRYRNTFEDAAVSLAASSLELNDFQVSSGTWKISEDSSKQKWLENVTAGVAAYIPSTQAFGTWQWEVYKGSDTSNVYVVFSETTNNRTGNGYEFHITSSEVLVIRKLVAGIPTNLMVSAAAYISIGTKYTIRITRNYAGAFNFYIRGGAYTSWTTVAVSVADLTYTSCKYFLFAALTTAGDKISNIIIREGVLDPVNFPEIV